MYVYNGGCCLIKQMRTKLRPGNTTRISVSELKDEATGEWVNDATVEATLFDSLGVAVEGQEWPLSLEYEAESNGEYSADMDFEAELEEGRRYLLQITAQIGNKRGTWRVPAIAEARTS